MHAIGRCGVERGERGGEYEGCERMSLFDETSPVSVVSSIPHAIRMSQDDQRSDLTLTGTTEARRIPLVFLSPRRSNREQMGGSMRRIGRRSRTRACSLSLLELVPPPSSRWRSK